MWTQNSVSLGKTCRTEVLTTRHLDTTDFGGPDITKRRLRCPSVVSRSPETPLTPRPDSWPRPVPSLRTCNSSTGTPRNLPYEWTLPDPQRNIPAKIIGLSVEDFESGLLGTDPDVGDLYRPRTEKNSRRTFPKVNIIRLSNLKILTQMDQRSIQTNQKRSLYKIGNRVKICSSIFTSSDWNTSEKMDGC